MSRNTFEDYLDNLVEQSNQQASYRTQSAEHFSTKEREDRAKNSSEEEEGWEDQGGALTIQTHNFEMYIKQLKENLSDLDPVYFTEVEVGGWFFGLGDHMVTGKEFNELVTQIQDYTIRNQDRDRKVQNELNIVYKTFEALDKDYISGIKISVEGAKAAIKKIEKTQSTLEKSNMEIKKNIDLCLDLGEKNQRSCVKNKEEIKRCISNIEEIQKEFQNKEKNMNEGNPMLLKKIKLAYLLSGCGIGLALIEFLLFFVLRIV